MKRTGFTGYAYDFSADYNYIGVDDIKNIHNYLIKKMVLHEHIMDNKLLFTV